MKDNPDGLDLATPSMCFHVDDLDATREACRRPRWVTTTALAASPSPTPRAAGSR